MRSSFDSGQVLVTGGAGFIGSHLVERLLAGGDAVVVVDDLSTGRRENLAMVAGHPRLRVIQAKVSGCAELAGIAATASYIYHLAAAVGVELVVKSPIYTIENNLRETEAVLAAASAHRTPLLFTSTSEVYGKSTKSEFRETDDLLIGPPTLGRWSYACSKLMDEFLALAYMRERGLPVTIVRVFNTVGPRQTGRFGMVLPRFLEAARNGTPLRVYGDGRQSRCFCYVGDTVEALLRLRSSSKARGEIFNVGSQEEISIGDLASRVIAELGSASTIELVPYDQALAPGFEDMRYRKPCTAKLAEFTGYRPGTTLAELIRRTAEYSAEGSGMPQSTARPEQTT